MRTPRIPAAELCRLGRLALPLMTPEARAEAETLIGWITENAEILKAEKLKANAEAAAAAFEADMRPVREAIIAALDDGDMESLRGLRALLPHLLSEVNEQPGLADVLAHQLGAEFLAGFSGSAESGELRAATENARPWNPALHPRGGRGRFAHGAQRQDQGRSREHRTRGQDQFGHLPDEHGRVSATNNMARGHRVIRFLRQPGQQVEKAMFRPDVGWVGMEYGKPDHDTGWGNSHIESKHGKAALAKVPAIIQHGTLHTHEKEENKRYLFHGDDLLILKRISGRQAWTVTSFEDPTRIERVRAAHPHKAKGGSL